MKTKPWKHQTEAVELIRSRPATFLAHDMGTGKTRVIVEAVEALKLARTLIVCPKSVMDVWEEEFRKHQTESIVVRLLDHATVAYKATFLHENVAVLYARPDFQQVFVVNYESVWREPLASAIRDVQWDLVVCDESHRTKNPWGKASKFFGKLRLRATKRVCLTGTPMPHSPLDVWAQFRFLDPNIYPRSFTQFKMRYAVMGGFQKNGRAVEVMGWQNQDELNQKFYSIAHRVKKGDVLDLPPYIHETRTFALGRDGRALYDDLEAGLRVQVANGEINPSNALVKLLRLQQLTSGYLPIEGQDYSTSVDMGKKHLLAEVLEDIGNEPVVVFCKFRHDLEMVHQVTKELRDPLNSSITKELDKWSYELSGSRNELGEWKAAKGPTVLAVQIQAGGVGIDLTRASYCIFYSLGFSLGDYEQAMARLHRPGQTRCVTYIHLVAENTIDGKVYRALAERKNVIEEILTEMRGTKEKDYHHGREPVSQVC